MIKLEAIGYLGKDAETKQVNNKTVINFSIAHTEKLTDAKGNKVEKTVWVECGKWGENANVAPYLKKGTLVYVSGTPEVSTWEDRSGKTQASLRLRVFDLQLLGGKKDGDNSNQQAPQSQQQQPAAQGGGSQPPLVAGEDDDLPF
jgi:single-strand DNA-binding protein